MFGFPLLLIPLAIVNIVVFLMPGVVFTAPAFTVALMSGTAWTVTFSDLLVAGGMALLLLEITKVARAGGRYVTDHLLSFLVLAGATAEFVLLEPFGTSTMFLLCALAFVDFFAGLTLHRRRVRAVPAAPAAAPPPPPPPPPAPVPTPRIEPELAPPPAAEPSQATPVPATPAPEPVAEKDPSLGSLVPGVAAAPPAGQSAPAPDASPSEPGAPPRP